MSDTQADQGGTDYRLPEALPLASSTLAEVLDGLRAPQGPPPPIGHHYSARSQDAAEREASRVQTRSDSSDR